MQFEAVWAALLNTDAYLKETAGKIREAEGKARRALGELERQFGTGDRKIDDRFIPRLERQFNALGFVFWRSAERAHFGFREFPSCYAEIDVFMENSDRALAVAVAARLGPPGENAADPGGLMGASIEDILEHLEQMEKLRRCFDLTGDRRELYGAVAAEAFPQEALEFALSQGLYAVEYTEEQVKARKPECGGKAW
jgi:hypothetical protein